MHLLRSAAHTENRYFINGAALLAMSLASAIFSHSTSCQAPTPSFTMMSEMYGDAGATAQQRMSQGLLTGATFHPTLTASESQFLTGNTPAPAFAYFAVPASANVSSCYPSSTDSNAGTLLTSYTQQIGSKVWDLGMPEFDQGGGCWANGRPSMAGLSDSTAYSTWTNYYLNTKQLSPYLSQTAQQRGYKWMTVSSFAFSTPYAFDMGADAALLERNEDEMSGITPGLAILRGTAFQHGGKDWGIDLSTWRYWNNGPTVYSNGRLVTGWSTATFKRNMYIAYMGGANILHNEAADYTTGAVSGSSLNPLGQTVQAFYNFAITRHPNRGTPFVPMALMQEHDSGFEPKFGEWMQGNSKWYWQNGYTQGDTMFANLLSLVYPNYNTWGTLPSGAPKVLNAGGSINVSATQTAYQQALANSADPRPWEPFGNSAWGETFDIITNQASLAAMQRYRAIVLSTGVAMSDSFLSTLTQYVNGGGILMLNAKQMSANSETLAGIHLTGSSSSATSETWIPDGSTINESLYNYSRATLTKAASIAQTSGNPIVTRNNYGLGTVYVTMPNFMANAGNTAILNVGQKLISMLQAQCAVVTVSGPKLEYLISTDTGKTIVTLVNTDITGATWNGTLSFPQPSGSYSVQEWTSDTLVGSSLQNGQVVVNASVPAFDVQIYVLSAPRVSRLSSEDRKSLSLSCRRLVCVSSASSEQRSLRWIKRALLNFWVDAPAHDVLIYGKEFAGIVSNHREIGQLSPLHKFRDDERSQMLRATDSSTAFCERQILTSRHSCSMFYRRREFCWFAPVTDRLPAAAQAEGFRSSEHRIYSRSTENVNSNVECRHARVHDHLSIL